MCLYIHPKQPLGAKGSYVTLKTPKHYLVWKVCRDIGHKSVVISWFRKSEYLFGKLYRLPIPMCQRYLVHDDTVHLGFHALRYKTNKWQGMRLGDPKNLYPCIIPAGSEVIYGQDGDVVSNQLIVFRDINQLNKWCANNPVT